MTVTDRVMLYYGGFDLRFLRRHERVRAAPSGGCEIVDTILGTAARFEKGDLICRRADGSLYAIKPTEANAR